MLQSVFTWIYCLDYPDALLLLGLSTGLFFAADTRLRKYRTWKAVLLVTLLLWAAVVALQTVFGRTPDDAYTFVWRPFQSYADAWKVGGQKELLRSNFMNGVLFYPAGLILMALLPMRWKPVPRVAAVSVLLTMFSVGIEVAQYRYRLGMAQTDDVIHNGLGALVGAAMMVLLPGIIQRIDSTDWKTENPELFG